MQCQFMMIPASISIWSIHSTTGYWTFTSRCRTKREGSVSKDTWATWMAMRDIFLWGDAWWVMRDASDVSCVSWLRWERGAWGSMREHEWSWVMGHNAHRAMTRMNHGLLAHGMKSGEMQLGFVLCIESPCKLLPNGHSDILAFHD